jgi:hypothetical protein
MQGNGHQWETGDTILLVQQMNKEQRPETDRKERQPGKVYQALRTFNFHEPPSLLNNYLG